MSRKRAEIYLLIGLAIWTLVYVVGTRRLGPPMIDGEPGKSLFPWFIIIAMMAACVAVLFETQKMPDSSMTTERSSVKRPLAGCIVVAVFILFFHFLGYWLSAAFLCFSTAYLFEYESVSRGRALAISALLGVVVPIVGYLFYEVLFHIRLPEARILW